MTIRIHSFCLDYINLTNKTSQDDKCSYINVDGFDGSRITRAFISLIRFVFFSWL